MWKPSGAAALLVSLAATAAPADLAGRVFRDRNGNGLPDPGEEAVAGTAELFGAADAGGFIDLNLATAPDGRFAAAAPLLDQGCFVLRVTPAAGFRLAPARRDCPGAGHPAPVGTRRYGSPRHLIDALRAGAGRHVGLGDSIAEPASGCVAFASSPDLDYVTRVGERLSCVAGGFATENRAVGGKTSVDLLRGAGTCDNPILHPFPTRCDNLYDTIAVNPELVTISIGGNDFLDVAPRDETEPFDPAEMATMVRKLNDTRANLQELLSALASELPASDVIVNTVYDNRARSCASSDFNNLWVPIWNQVLREVTWGQGERFHVAEVYPEYAHQDLNGANCCAAQGLICDLDTSIGIDPPIHPNAAGARFHRERLWEAAGGVNLGPRDPLGAVTKTDLLFPAVEKLATRFASLTEDRTSGAANPNEALARDGVYTSLPAGSGEFRLAGFDTAPAGIVPTQVVVTVRYRTSQSPPANPEYDAVYFEASLDGSFAAPQPTVTGWNTIVPIVGAGGNAPQPNALADLPQWREVSALLSRNLRDDGRAVGQYDFAPPGWSDLATLVVRYRGVTRGAVDAFRVELDAAWIDVYGHRAPAPGADIYRDVSPQAIVQPANRIATGAMPPFDDLAPAGALFYYAADDGAGNPARILMVRAGAAARVTWP